jgi:hypothetical protein
MKAPYEGKETPTRKFDVEASFLIRKQTTVETNDYDIEHDDFEKEAFIHTELTDWESEFSSQHFNIDEMLCELCVYVEDEMRNVPPYSGRGRYLKRLLNDAQGWEVVEQEVVEV